MTEQLIISQTILDEACNELHTIRDFIRFTVSMLRAHEVSLGQGTDDAFAEASALVLQSLSLSWTADEQILDSRLLSSERRVVVDLLAQRINERKPLAYLLNVAYFCDLPFYVDERVLIPRSPIAELIKQQFAPYFNAADIDPDLPEEQTNPHGLPWPRYPATPQHMLDLCTGSGCIAIALALHFEDVTVDAVDISRDALEVAAVNVAHHGVDSQVNLIESDLLAKIPPQQQYDLIVSNPPYVDAHDMAELPPEFEFEPELALAAGRDGLDIVRQILAQAADYLTDNGLLVVEVGNSAWALTQTFPEVEFYWLNFARGGSGVFALTAAQCRTYQQLFKAQQV